MSIENQIAFLESRLKDNPKSLVFARLADLYLDQNRMDEAIRLCTAGVKYNPSYVTGNYVLAKAYILSDDYENAESALKQVVSHDREFLSAHKLLGDLMRKLGWDNKAAAHYRNIIQIDPLEEKVRSILESLNESIADEATDQPDSDPFEESTAKPKTDNPEASDWINEIREVFPDEIGSEPESVQPGASTLKKTIHAPERAFDSENRLDAESAESFSEVGSDKPATPGGDGADAIIDSESNPEGPVISDTPEFFAIKDEENVPADKIAAEFLAPEQLSGPESNQVGEEVLLDEVEISEVTQSVEADERETSDVRLDEITDVDSPLSSEEDGSDFAQALDALEAMDSDVDSATETPLSRNADIEKSPASDPQDEPLMHEDSGLIPRDVSEPEKSDTKTRHQVPSTLSECDSGEALFEWALPDETMPVSNAPDDEKVIQADEPLIQGETGISETESFTLEDLNLDTKAESSQSPVEGPRIDDKGADSEPKSHETSKKSLTPKSTAKSSSGKTKAKTPKQAPPETEHSQQNVNASEEEVESEKAKTKSSPKIVTPTLGEIYAAQGQYDKAIAVFEELLQQHPDEKRYKDKIAELKRNLENPL